MARQTTALLEIKYTFACLYIVGEPEIQKLGKKWPESSRILEYILC